MALDTFKPYLFVSAGEQSNKFLTPTYSDGIAQFQAQRAQSLTGLTVRIDPIQEGTGDPSPTNIRPISGRTGLTVTCAVGKNMLPNGIQAQMTSGITFTIDKGKVIANGTATATIALTISDSCALAPGDYIMTGCPAGGGASSHYKIDIVRNGESSRKIDTGSGTTFTVDTAGLYTARIVIYSGEVCNNLTFAPMVRLSGESADYVPYAGAAVYTVSWETEAGTVYGGTLDLVSGVLTVDWDYIASYDGETLPGEWISDRDVYAEGTTPTTGAEVVYKIVEPVTYQLDPEQIMTLPGFNQIYSDAGPVIDIKF